MRSTSSRARPSESRRGDRAQQGAGGEPGVVDRESQRLAGRALDAAEAEAQRATRVIPEAGERDHGCRSSDHEHGGGGADGRAGGDVRHRRRGGAHAGGGAQRALRRIGARPVSARLRCSLPWATSPRASASEWGMRTSRSQRCLARCRSARTLALRAAIECGGGEQLAPALRAGQDVAVEQGLRAGERGPGGGQRPDDVAGFVEHGACRGPVGSAVDDHEAVGGARFAQQGAEMLRLGLRVAAGWGGEQAQTWLELDERSRGRLPVGHLLGELAEAERAGLPGEHGKAGAAGSPAR